MKVLFIASRTQEATVLEVEREIMELQLHFADLPSENLQAVFLPDMTVDKLPNALRKIKPDVLHVTAHGSEEGLWFVKEAFGGEPRQEVLVTANALAKHFNVKTPPKLILLNACESSKVAKALGQSGYLAIGTTEPITNQAAIGVTSVFYDRLLSGAKISDAFSAASAQASTLQDNPIELNLEVPAGRSADFPLVYEPTLVAKLDTDAKIKAGKPIPCYLGVVGHPMGTCQVVFFTTDNSFLTNSNNPNYEEDLSEIIQTNEYTGEIWTETEWMPEGDFRIAACGITTEGRTFSLSGMLVQALHAYAAFKPVSDKYRDALKLACEILEAYE